MAIGSLGIACPAWPYAARKTLAPAIVATLWALDPKLRPVTLFNQNPDSFHSEYAVETVLRHSNSEKVHIIGHSMGGLDARRMLFDFRGEEFHKKVASVTTIGTPHHGSPVVEFLLTAFRGQIEDLGMALEGLKDLAPGAMQQLNRELESFERSRRQVSGLCWPAVLDGSLRPAKALLVHDQ